MSETFVLDFSVVNDEAIKGVENTFTGAHTIELLTQAGPMLVLPTGKLKNVAEYPGQVMALTLAIPGPCCGAFSFSWAVSPSVCKKCNDAVLWEVTYPVITIHTNHSSWADEEIFVEDISAMFTQDAMTNIIWASELYAYLKTHFKAYESKLWEGLL